MSAPHPDPEIIDGVWHGFRESPARIRIVSRCIIRGGDGALLVIRCRDEVKNQTFYVPPGGGVRFGERATEAIEREVMEELECGLASLRPLGMLENFFTHRGFSGHEVVFVYEGELAAASIYERDGFDVSDGGERLTAFWMRAEQFRSVNRPELPPLYPDGILALAAGHVR